MHGKGSLLIEKVRTQRRQCGRCDAGLPLDAHPNLRYCGECIAARRREQTRAAMRDRRLPFDKGGPVNKYGSCSYCRRQADLYHHKSYRNLHCCSKECLDAALAHRAADPWAWKEYEGY
jgi:ribosomal protein S27AE